MRESPLTNARARLGWALDPNPADNPRAQSIAFTVLRVLLGLMWLYNVSWKRAPDFGKDAGSGLYKFTTYAVDYPVLAPYAWVTDHLILPVFPVFGWVVLIAETALAVMLLTGTLVRLAALIGLAQSLAIGLSVAYAPHEWPWSYFLMVGAHLVLIFAVAGRVLGTDGVRTGDTSARTLGHVWAGVALVAGLVSLVRSLSEPFAARGPDLGNSDPSLSLGSYNLVGSLVLVTVGVLLLVGARLTLPWALQAAAALGLLAGLSLHAQLGFSDPVIGGNPTSAAVFFSLALIAFLVGRAPSPGSIAQTPSPARTESTQP
ncbi:Rv1678 family membrane protein [Nocardioides rubriscoriae]|uniref:Rv1678 family membrane protein n=1 Tax=Nocardioides rubriscoriae TaxID=642762 RepID=UPI0011DF842D|nr:DoxX family protein [Nocardioides rubriscoriae]